jgi:hypothetical protein
MNARSDRFVKPCLRLGVRNAGVRLGACLLAAGALSGCASSLDNPFATAPVDPASPIAADVAKVAETNRDYPSFNDIPKAPADQRPAKAWGQAVAEVTAARDQLERETGPGAWSLGGTDAFADRAAADAGSGAAGGSTADTEAFARAARERATPPPQPR